MWSAQEAKRLQERSARRACKPAMHMHASAAPFAGSHLVGGEAAPQERCRQLSTGPDRLRHAALRACQGSHLATSAGAHERQERLLHTGEGGDGVQ